jgi:hypothetical protein
MDKRNIGRFCVQFNITNPRHLQVVELLEAQGRRKSQYITEAVLFYSEHMKSSDDNVQSLIKKGKPLAGNGKAHKASQQKEKAPKTLNLSEQGAIMDDELLVSMRESFSSLRDEIV